MIGLFVSVYSFLQPLTEVAAVVPPATVAPSITAPIVRPTPTATTTPQPQPVGLLAGHSGGIDTGAICQDGLREVDITTDVAQRAKKILEGRGYRVDILAEFDSKLNATRRDYSPRAFLAIHVDSCITYASGYKVARAANSVIPQEDDRLVRCVTAAYGETTQLPFHSNSITSDMTLYHALEEINPKSPGAIIELGFLGSERNLLKNRRDLVASGVADGLINFLSGNQCQQVQ